MDAGRRLIRFGHRRSRKFSGGAGDGNFSQVFQRDETGAWNFGQLDDSREEGKQGDVAEGYSVAGGWEFFQFNIWQRESLGEIFLQL